MGRTRSRMEGLARPKHKNTREADRMKYFEISWDMLGGWDAGDYVAWVAEHPDNTPEKLAEDLVQIWDGDEYKIEKEEMVRFFEKESINYFKWRA